MNNMAKVLNMRIAYLERIRTVHCHWPSKRRCCWRCLISNRAISLKKAPGRHKAPSLNLRHHQAARSTTTISVDY